MSISRIVLTLLAVQLATSCILAQAHDVPTVAPSGCLYLDPPQLNSWASFLNFQIKALHVEDSASLALGKKHPTGEAGLIEFLGGIKKAITASECSAFLVATFRQSTDDDLKTAAFALSDAYAEYASHEKTFLDGIVHGDFWTNQMARADSISTLGQKTDAVQSWTIKSIGLTLIKLIDPEKRDAQDHLTHLVLSSAEIRALKETLREEFPKLSGPDHADWSGWMKTADMVTTFLGAGRKAADVP